MSISMNELLKGTPISDVEITHQQNLEVLKDKLNVIREKWGKPMVVTSGYRSMQDHKRIYSEINSKRKKQNLKELTVPMGSKHLVGKACDISDPDQSLQKWILENESLLEELGLYCEHFSATKNWVHFQTEAPKSKSRFFYP